jgi:hypothetical protein
MDRTKMHQAIGGILMATASAVMVLGLGGCASHGYGYYRPGVAQFVSGDTGLQSRDLVDMTDKLAADLLKIPQIANNPNKVVIQVTSIRNQTSTPWQNDQIYLARMRTLLAKYAGNEIAFTLPPQQLAQIQQETLGGSTGGFEQGSRGAAPTSGRLIPQYALTGVFYDLPNSATTYYLCEFQLVDIRTGQLIWDGKYEVRTLNLY